MYVVVTVSGFTGATAGGSVGNAAGVAGVMSLMVGYAVCSAQNIFRFCLGTHRVAKALGFVARKRKSSLDWNATLTVRMDVRVIDFL